MPRHSLRWSRKRRFTGNIHTRKNLNNATDNTRQQTVNSGTHNPSSANASAQKISDSFSETTWDFDVDKSGYRLIHISVLNSFLQSYALCGECEVGYLDVKEHLNSRRGWASKLGLYCDDCSFSVSFFTSDTVEESDLFDVNLRLCYAMRCIGKAQKSAKVFSDIMDMPPPVSNFQRYTKLLLL